MPGLPHPVFLVLGGCAFGLAEFARRRARSGARADAEARAEAKRRAMRRPELALGLVGVDAVAIEIVGLNKWFGAFQVLRELPLK